MNPPLANSAAQNAGYQEQQSDNAANTGEVCQPDLSMPEVSK